MTSAQGEQTLTPGTAPEPPATSTAPPARRVRDWPAVAGIAFAPLFIAALGTSTSGAPETDAPIAEWVDWATDDGNGAIAVLSVYVTVIAALAFAVFATGLARRIRVARDETGLAGGYVHGLGLLAAGFLAAAGIAWNNGPIPHIFDDKLPDPTDIHVFVQLQSLGYGLAFVGMALAAAALIAVTSASLRDSMPAWFTIAGYIAAVALLGSLMFVPLLAFPLWTLIAGILLLRRPLTT
jgi:hypothetical protein